MTTEHDDTGYEPPHTSSTTDYVLAELRAVGGEFLSARAREEQCLPADPARSALARSLRTSDL
jgi:hypothetical protein